MSIVVAGFMAWVALICLFVAWLFARKGYGRDAAWTVGAASLVALGAVIAWVFR